MWFREPFLLSWRCALKSSLQHTDEDSEVPKQYLYLQCNIYLYHNVYLKKDALIATYRVGNEVQTNYNENIISCDGGCGRGGYRLNEKE